MAPNISRSPSTQGDCADDGVLWINSSIMEPMRATMTVSQIGMAWLLAAIIATEGPVPVSDVRKVLNIAPRKWGMPLDRLGFMFVISDGIVDLNDYAFVSEDGAE